MVAAVTAGKVDEFLTLSTDERPQLPVSMARQIELSGEEAGRCNLLRSYRDSVVFAGGLGDQALGRVV